MKQNRKLHERETESKCRVQPEATLTTLTISEEQEIISLSKNMKQLIKNEELSKCICGNFLFIGLSPN